jgi:prophage regulatory protein
MQIQNEILRLPAVLKARGVSRSRHYIDVKSGLFPRPIKLSTRAVGWLRAEVNAVIAASVSGADRDSLRALSTEIEARRLRLRPESHLMGGE